jgi:hypothetical protein
MVAGHISSSRVYLSEQSFLLTTPLATGRGSKLTSRQVEIKPSGFRNSELPSRKVAAGPLAVRMPHCVMIGWRRCHGPATSARRAYSLNNCREWSQPCETLGTACPVSSIAAVVWLAHLVTQQFHGNELQFLKRLDAPGLGTYPVRT